ncbi:MAG: tetratricopeptide repeat protein [Methylococcales bacterium]
MKRIRKIFILLVLVGVAACASYHRPYNSPSDNPPPKHPPPNNSSPKKPYQEPAAQTSPANPQPEVHVSKAPSVHEVPAAPSSPAVIALLDAAEGERQSGQLDSAVATLERAIKIQPRNAMLWHQMAVLRLEQYKPRLALDLARKSNTLASGDRSLKQENSRIIAEAKRLLGDLEGAAKAREKADR